MKQHFQADPDYMLAAFWRQINLEGCPQGPNLKEAATAAKDKRG